MNIIKKAAKTARQSTVKKAVRGAVAKNLAKKSGANGNKVARKATKRK